ncbi:hypothetical protein ACQZ5D_15020 [Agrobacterium sp. 22-211-1]
METNLSFEAKNGTLFLSTALGAVSNALDDAIEALAQTKGVDDLSWLDELHQKALVAAKGTITEDVSIDVEAPAIKFGIDLINAKFAGYRKSFSSEV